MNRSDEPPEPVERASLLAWLADGVVVPIRIDRNGCVVLSDDDVRRIAQATAIEIDRRSNEVREL